MSRRPARPQGLGAAGRRLWQAVLEEFELEEQELTLLRQAVRVADTCDELHRLVLEAGLIVDGKSNPALVELRLQRILLARLIVALRVPLGEEEAASRSQRRGTRGVYSIRSAS